MGDTAYWDGLPDSLRNLRAFGDAAQGEIRKDSDSSDVRVG